MLATRDSRYHAAMQQISSTIELWPEFKPSARCTVGGGGSVKNCGELAEFLASYPTISKQGIQCQRRALCREHAEAFAMQRHLTMPVPSGRENAARS